MIKNSSGFFRKAGIGLTALATGISGCNIKLTVENVIPAVEETRVVEEEDGREFSLDILAPKNAYGVGENFRADFRFQFSGGEPFRGVILNTKSRLGFEGEYTGREGTTFYEGESHSSDLRAFERVGDEFGNTYSCCHDAFNDPGYYKFEVGVYDCLDIEQKLVVDCSEVESEHIREHITPLISTVRTFLVED